jgi:hypothetical protein
MHVRKKLWILVLVGLLAVFVGYRYMLSTSHLFDCVNSPLSEIVSPDGRYAVVVFERNCGATSPFLRVVSIHAKGEAFDGNIKKAWIFEIKDQPTVNVRWSGPRQLIVSHSPSGKKLLERETFGDVAIAVREE